MRYLKSKSTGRVFEDQGTELMDIHTGETLNREEWIGDLVPFQLEAEDVRQLKPSWAKKLGVNMEDVGGSKDYASIVYHALSSAGVSFENIGVTDGGKGIIVTVSNADPNKVFHALMTAGYATNIGKNEEGDVEIYFDEGQ